MPMPAFAMRPAQPPGWPRWVEALAVVAFWALLGAVALVRRALVPNPPFSLHTIAVTAVEYGPWLVLTPAVFWLARRLPLERKQWVIRLALHLAIAGAVTLALGTLHRLAIPALGPPQGVGALPEPPSAPGATAEAGAQRAPRPGPSPGQRPPGASTARPERPPLAAPSIHFAFYLFVLGVGFARAYAIQVQARQAEADRLEAEAARLDAERARLAAQLTEAQLGALRMQLNPHFFLQRAQRRERAGRHRPRRRPPDRRTALGAAPARAGQ